MVEISEIGEISAEIFYGLIFPKLGADNDGKLNHPVVDSFWKAFYDTLARYKG
jgi:hypothetical protein